MSIVNKLFKSKEEKALEAKLAVRQGIRDLTKCERSLEKKKKEMIKLAQDAKKQGITQQYEVARSGLKMVLSYQKRCQAMTLQLKMTETMRDLTMIGSNFVKLMGDVGAELKKVTQSTNFVRNQASFEKGVLAAEAAMDKLEGFMEDAGMTFETQSEEELDAQIDQLIDSMAAAEPDPLDVEIDRRLDESTAKRAELENQPKGE